MKFFHLSDLHIGKCLNGYSLKENQEEVFRQIVEAARQYRPDAILICGDVYDKSVPAAEAYTVFDHFLSELAGIEPSIPVLIIAGNHDSPERLNYASAFLERHHIYLSVLPPEREEEYLKKIVLTDEYGPVNFYLLPFLKPGYVRGLMAEERAGCTYEEAVSFVLKREKIDREERNVLLSHQFYISGEDRPQVCDSEQPSLTVGGLDEIDIRVLEDFDYAALGHLHGAQRVGRESVRYCGSPYKYSVSEERHEKAVTLVTLGEKGKEPEIQYLPLHGLQDVRRERGNLEEILRRGTEETRHDFVSVTVTDERESFAMREQLEEVYDHLLEFHMDNDRVRKTLEETGEEIPVLRPYEAFCQFYQAVRHGAMSEEEEAVMKKIIEEAKEEDA